jgi:hypothetical protein
MYYFRLASEFRNSLKKNAGSDTYQQFLDLESLTFDAFYRKHRISWLVAAANFQRIAGTLGFGAETWIPPVYTANSMIIRCGIEYSLRIIIFEQTVHSTPLALCFHVAYTKSDYIYGRLTGFAGEVFDVYKYPICGALESLGIPDPCPNAILPRDYWIMNNSTTEYGP